VWPSETISYHDRFEIGCSRIGTPSRTLPLVKVKAASIYALRPQGSKSARAGNVDLSPAPATDSVTEWGKPRKSKGRLSRSKLTNRCRTSNTNRGVAYPWRYFLAKGPVGKAKGAGFRSRASAWNCLTQLRATVGPRGPSRTRVNAGDPIAISHRSERQAAIFLIDHAKLLDLKCCPCVCVWSD
jgi:hypothetical protein